MTYYRVLKYNGGGWDTISGYDNIEEATAKYEETKAKFPNDIIALRGKYTGRLPYVIQRSDRE